ncbi:MAG: TauD/TfdA family dioxygenase [Pseudomonadota bacterium]
MTWTVNRITGALGAEVHGVALNRLSEPQFAELKALLLEHQVLFFPEQALSIDDHVELGKRFGPLDAHPNLKNPFTDRTDIFELAASAGGIADEWHTDLTFQTEPAVLSILHLVRCPEVGGDTMWASMTAAFDALSEPMKAFLEELTALHDALPHHRPDRMAVHPVIRVHPDTGRRALYVNEHFTRRIVELSAEESDALLGYLTRWVASPRFTVRYRWAEGTFCMWDNRCTQHCVMNDFNGERVIQRVTVMGDRPEGTGSQRWQPYLRGGALSATSRHDRQLQFFLNDRPYHLGPKPDAA